MTSWQQAILENIIDRPSRFKYLYELLSETKNIEISSKQSIESITALRDRLSPIESVESEMQLYKRLNAASIEFADALKALIDHLER